MLTIKQTQAILDMSYPTALALATNTGTQMSGRWYIPDSIVAARIATERRQVEKKEQRLRLELAVNIL